MTTHITKTWFDGDKVMTQEIPESEVYKQEPVAWINAEKRTFEWNGPILWRTPTVAVLDKIPLYTTPPQRTWVGLTDEEIVELHHEIKVQLMGTYKTEDIYRAIEAKLKDKNT